MVPQLDTPVMIREMRSDDLEEAHGLSSKEKWPHRIQEWQWCFDLGFGFVAEQSGNIVGTAMGWPFTDQVSSLGLVIVSPECRGQGLARKLMDVVINKLGERAVMLISTADGLPLYKKYNFEAKDAILQHQGACFTAPLLMADESQRIRPLGNSDIDTIVHLDECAVGFKRTEVLAELLESGQGIVLEYPDGPVGFSIFRRFGRGYVIGPTISPNIEGAKMMISHWLRANPGMFIRIDISEESGLSEWLDGLGVTRVDRVTRMVLGDLPGSDNRENIFSIVNQAIG